MKPSFFFTPFSLNILFFSFFGVWDIESASQQIASIPGEDSKRIFFCSSSSLCCLVSLFLLYLIHSWKNKKRGREREIGENRRFSFYSWCYVFCWRHCCVKNNFYWHSLTVWDLVMFNLNEMFFIVQIDKCELDRKFGWKHHLHSMKSLPLPAPPHPRTMTYNIL